MQTYLFITGKEHKLAFEELQKVIQTYGYEMHILQQKNYVLTVKANLPKDILKKLANTTKIAQVIAQGTSEEIEYELDHQELYSRKEKNFTYFITEYDRTTADMFTQYAKARFKEEGLKAMYKKEQNPTPSKLLNKNAMEFIITKDAIAKVIQITNVKKIKERDEKRPHPNYSQSISLRLAKTLVNLAGCSKGDWILDPNPGDGTILQEAYCLNINSIGITDEKNTKKNIAWLKKTYTKDAQVEVTNKVTRRVDAIITKPPLGPQLKRLPKAVDARMFAKDYIRDVQKILETYTNKTKKDARLILIVPTWHTTEHKTVTPNVQEVLKEYSQEGWFSLQAKKGTKLSLSILIAAKDL